MRPSSSFVPLRPSSSRPSAVSQLLQHRFFLLSQGSVIPVGPRNQTGALLCVNISCYDQILSAIVLRVNVFVVVLCVPPLLGLPHIGFSDRINHVFEHFFPV